MNRKRFAYTLVLVVIAAALLAACAPATPTPELLNDEFGGATGGGDVAATEAAIAPEAPLSDGARSNVAASPAAYPTAASAFVAGGAPVVGAVEDKAADSAEAAPGLAGGPAALPPSGGGGSVPVYSPPDQQFQGMTAGEVDDNRDWEAYLQYRLDYHRFNGSTVHDIEVSERHTIRVRTPGGQPVLGADVMVYDGQTLVTTLRTTATGLAYFFPLAYPQNAQAQAYSVVVQKDQATQTATIARASQDDIVSVTLNVSPSSPPVKLDVLFLLDSTGSMDDEIDQLKNNLLSISAQIAALPSRPSVRYGLVTYRDRGDQYVTRVADFTPDVQDFQLSLQSVEAAGGGDIPESLNEGLHAALANVQWRGADTVKLVFLVADAPPHLDYEQDYDYAQEIENAASLGIKIHPIASSGLDDQGEYVFRQIAQVTGGRFIFLTYDDQPQTSGEPGTDLHVQEGQYSVLDLDSLVVRLIQDELAQLNAQQ